MNEKKLAEIGQRIQRLREDCGITQQALADALGVKRTVIGKWEVGIQDLKTENIIALAAFFGVSCDFLLGVSNFRDPNNENLSADLGLSEKAIETIRECRTNDLMPGLNIYLESKEFLQIIHTVNDLVTFVPELIIRKYFENFINKVETTDELDEKIKQVTSVLINWTVTESAKWLSWIKQDVSQTMNQFIDCVANKFVREGNLGKR